MRFVRETGIAPEGKVRRVDFRAGPAAPLLDG
jgi:hypothetical protein